MSMFGFDDQSTMFDVTPVENQFILEYMLTAKGDHVKVYLYGLMHCYHPRDDMSVDQIAHDLGMSNEEVMQAFRHWERKGLVQRVSDRPPVFRYVNVRQHMMRGGQAQSDPAYESFAESVYALFGSDRRIHGKEMTLCYEWVEELKLPPEVVLLLLQHMIAMRGKGFSIQSAQKLAVQLADENAFTVEDAEQVLTRDKAAWQGSRAVLRRMGKRRAPSEDEMSLYTKWNSEWGFAPDAIEAACSRTTRGDPSFAYLDGILRGMMERGGSAESAQAVQRIIERDQERIAPLKHLLSMLGVRELTVNEGTLRIWDELKSLYDDEQIIYLAARECAPRGGRLDDVSALLQAWKRRGIQSLEEAVLHISRVKQQDQFLRRLYELWGRQTRPGANDRRMLESWQGKAYDEPFILACAALVGDASRPMAYLDAIMNGMAERGITTADGVQTERAQHGGKQQAKQSEPRKLREQQYEQRVYQVSTGMPDWLREMKEAMEAEQHDAGTDPVGAVGGIQTPSDT